VQLRKRLGQGSFASVYLGDIQVNGEPVAAGECWRGAVCWWFRSVCVGGGAESCIMNAPAATRVSPLIAVTAMVGT
jgi:hypothetical protein